MKKQNKNIFSHIIEEDYRAKKQKQNEHFEISGKAIPLNELQKKNSSVFEQLRQMHSPFAEPELPEPNDDLNQTKQQNSSKPMNSPAISELYAFYQKTKTEEQELLNRKQNLLSMEQNLIERLLKEIDIKKKSIKALNQEITALEDTCREISQELELTYN
jgi:hypothetical protein